jgi:hypothetical protein
MHDIYFNASAVIIWLGLPSDDDAKVFLEVEKHKDDQSPTKQRIKWDAWELLFSKP